MDSHAVTNIWKRSLRLVSFSLLFYTSLSLHSAFAEQYELRLLADFSHISPKKSNTKWLTPIINPDNQDELFIGRSDGVIYLLNTEQPNKQKKVLILGSGHQKDTAITFTSMAIHPSFIRPEEAGFATIYTAHTVKLNPQTPHILATQDNTDLQLRFATVITAWQYDFAQRQINPDSQREVLTLPIQSVDEGITNLAFDPYQKSWGADYGHLYFSINRMDGGHDLALYSGAILRINPQVYGNRNYTVPQQNPFRDDPAINDEIVIMGLGYIQHFFWAKNKKETIFIQHNNTQEYWLSETNIGDNYLSQIPRNYLKQQSQLMPTYMYYQGRHFPTLRNNFVSLQGQDNQWVLHYFSSAPGEPATYVEVLNTKVLSAPMLVHINQDSNKDIFVFDRQSETLYDVQHLQPDEITTTHVEENASDTGFNGVVYVFLGGLGLFLLVFTYRFNKNKDVTTQLLQKNQLKMRYDSYSKNILLYKSNQGNVIKSFLLEDIIAGEVLLNGHSIVQVDSQTEHFFSNQLESRLRAQFTDEHFEKMVDDKTRTIELVLTDEQQSFTACLYYRKGKVRTTSAKFHEVVDMVLALCWDLSKQIQPTHTEERIKPIDKVEHYATPVKPKQIEAEVKEQDTQMVTEPEIPMSVDVVEALEKLVNLHQQGYLSDEEFTVAKSKLLQ